MNRVIGVIVQVKIVSLRGGDPLLFLMILLDLD